MSVGVDENEQAEHVIDNNDRIVAASSHRTLTEKGLEGAEAQRVMHNIDISPSSTVVLPTRSELYGK